MTETIDTAQPKALRLADWLQSAVATYPQMSEEEPGGYCQEIDQVMDQAAAELRRLHSALAAAEARNATLTDDAARLDWLEQGGIGSIRLHGATGRDSSYLDWGGGLRNKTLRAAIDAARAAASISTNPTGDGHADPR